MAGSMAKEGKRLELYEILAEKRAKGIPLLEKPAVRSINPPPPVPAKPAKVPVQNPAQNYDYYTQATTFAPKRAENIALEPKIEEMQLAEVFSEPENVKKNPEVARVEPRAKSAKEIVFALDTAFMVFFAVTVLLISAYLLGYKRGQEEKNIVAGNAEIDNADLAGINLRSLPPAIRSVTRPPEQDYTLILRTEPVKDVDLRRLDLELAEAMLRGRKDVGVDIQGYIYRTSGTEPRYVLAVGLGKTRDDAGLEKLRNVYSKMERLTMSREETPFQAANIAQVKDLGQVVE